MITLLFMIIYAKSTNTFFCSIDYSNSKNEIHFFDIQVTFVHIFKTFSGH